MFINFASSKFKGNFRLLDYKITHCMLLLRASEIINSKNSNIDILFEGIFYIEMPVDLDDIVISEGNEKDYEYISAKCYFKIYKNFQKVYKIASNEKIYYIGASNVRLEKNNLPPLVSSIKDMGY